MFFWIFYRAYHDGPVLLVCRVVRLWGKAMLTFVF